MSSIEPAPGSAPTDAAHGAPPAPTPPRRRRGLRLSFVPTIVTLGNTVSGLLAISYLIDAGTCFGRGASAEAAAKVTTAGWMILLGMFCDMLDGRLARLTRSTSSFGGALDSLADVVTFGIAPALLAKTMAEGLLHWSQSQASFVAACFYAVCATLRLARYNAEHDEPDQAVASFQGLPTPGAAGVIAGLAICHPQVLEWIGSGEGASLVAARSLLFVGLLGLGLLMVSRVPYLHFANRFLSGKRPVGRVAIVLLLATLVAAADEYRPVVLAAGFVAYALSGPVLVIPRLLRRRREDVPQLLDA